MFRVALRFILMQWVLNANCTIDNRMTCIKMVVFCTNSVAILERLMSCDNVNYNKNDHPHKESITLVNKSQHML